MSRADNIEDRYETDCRRNGHPSVIRVESEGVENFPPGVYYDVRGVFTRNQRRRVEEMALGAAHAYANARRISVEQARHHLAVRDNARWALLVTLVALGYARHLTV